MTTTSAEGTQALAALLAQQCGPGDCILLRGDLGTGKTAFARGFISALQAEAEDIVSPTFTLAQTYPTRKGNTVWHFDLYRLRHAGEVVELGMEEALQNGITLVEWPELIEGRVSPQALHIQLAYGSVPDSRELTLSGDASRWRSCLAALEKQH